MIGNDIVDLEAAQQNSRWQEQRFLDKLFLEDEQDFIFSENDRFRKIWRLWSMKESVYKIISRVEGRFRFNPKDFHCIITNLTEGSVVYKNRCIKTITITHPKYLQTTAFLTNNWISKVIRLSFSDTHYQHITTYARVIEKYRLMKQQPIDLVEIRKDAMGIPQFYIDNRLQQEQLSLSHHGYFAAWVITV